MSDAPAVQRIERPIQFSAEMVRAILTGAKTQTRRAIVPDPDMIRRIKGVPQALRDRKPVACRFGEVGDRLWVRERWAPDDSRFIYAADQPSNGTHRWRPSYMMPRAACRIVLEITSLRIERLAGISRDDARAEGFPHDQSSDPVEWFRELWEELAQPQHLWKQNPWVWVIGFQRVENV